MPLLHLPVQSGSNKILKNMNRGHTIEEYLEIIEKLKDKKPNIKLSVFLFNTDKQTPFKFNDKTIIPIEVFHNTLPVMGFRIDNFCYLTDVKTISEKEQKKLKGLDILVLSALHNDPHPSHLNLEEALVMIEKINPKKAFLTHISHLMGFHDEVSKNLPHNVFLAYDTLMVISN